MQELNLTPMQYLITVLALLLLIGILSHFKGHTTIDLPELEPETKPVGNPYYGAYMQSQSNYYN